MFHFILITSQPSTFSFFEIYRETLRVSSIYGLYNPSQISQFLRYNQVLGRVGKLFVMPANMFRKIKIGEGDTSIFDRFDVEYTIYAFVFSTSAKLIISES
jgi:hypothetical protein